MYDFAVRPSEYPFKNDALFIGEDEHGNPLGIATKRHAITIAGSRTGKGVGVINTNLRTWRHNVLVIDPKGEAAEVSWQARRDLGQAVHVLDPFHEADIPNDIRASYNPLDDLDPKSRTIKEDIGVIADGIVMRSGDSGAVMWDNGTMRVIAGLIAFVITNLPPKEQNLLAVRRILTDQAKGGLWDTVVDEMASTTDEGTLPSMMRTAASRVRAKEGKYYVSGAEENTDWLDSEGMQDVLSSSSFSMRDLKRKKISVFVALPFAYLPQQQHGRFLRLMVRCGIKSMQEKTADGKKLGQKCLFILDEFFSLGYIDEVATSIGGMAGYGLHLWPFLQDLDQLWKLYGRDGAGTFFGSSDLQQFFGVTDQPTLEYISAKIGAFNVDDLPDEPALNLASQERQNIDRQLTAAWDRLEKTKAMLETSRQRHGFWDVATLPFESEKDRAYMEWNKLSHRRIDEGKVAKQEYDLRLARFQTDASRMLGKPRLSPDQIGSLIRLEEAAPTAEAQIAFVRGGRPLICKLARYFEWNETPVGETDYNDPEVHKRAIDAALAGAEAKRKTRLIIAHKQQISGTNSHLVDGKEHQGKPKSTCATCQVCKAVTYYDNEENYTILGGASSGSAWHNDNCSQCGYDVGVRFWNGASYVTLFELNKKPSRVRSFFQALDR
jgi:type IV secretion system protein VirD4